MSDDAGFFKKTANTLCKADRQNALRETTAERSAKIQVYEKEKRK